MTRRPGQHVSLSHVVRLRKFKLWDDIFAGLTRSAAIAVLVLLGGVIVALIIGSRLAFETFGFSFLTREVWNPVTDEYGALAPIYGTIVTSLIAMVIAVPVGLGIAIFLTELCPYSAAPPDRHRHRASGRHSQHHLRHLGPVRLRAVPAAICSAGADHRLRTDPRA